ncbi:serine hydrolase [Labilibaculum manganireducens]|uniref:serine hydrolase domain-containing protein n=1 Tax=Labilibaculum manganireducens TaxID=1940525 RepID=UPI0029F4B3BE|nr:serine hydrolase [Labilibaculum manganireducens]
MKNLIGVLIILSFIGCNTKNDCSYQKPIDINDGLKVSTLDSSKLDTAIFNKLNQDICNGKYGNIHSLLVIENNNLVIEQYYNNWENGRLHILASNTKSFNSLLIGVAIEQGCIKSVDQRMLDFFPEYENLKKDTLKNKITIKDLLTMTSGFKWDEHSLPLTDQNNMGRQMDKTEDWLKSSLELPMDTIPGTKYVYSGPNNIILSEIIKRSTGKNIAEFAQEYLFEPLGIKEYNWISKNGIYDGGGGLSLKSRDIAKYGLLHLNKGKWIDTEIVSENWINEIFTPFIEIKHPFYSCYQWQMVKTEFGFNAWFIPGNGGQIINIIPDLDMVIVINADNRNVPHKKLEPLEYLVKDIAQLHPKMKNE